MFPKEVSRCQSAYLESVDQHWDVAEKMDSILSTVGYVRVADTASISPPPSVQFITVWKQHSQGCYATQAEFPPQLFSY
jgi:hypothetical protein